MRSLIALFCIFSIFVSITTVQAEEVIWRARATSISQSIVPDSGSIGLGPSFVFADFALAQVFVECNPGMPRIGLPGTMNFVTTYFRDDAQVNFEFLPGAQFNPQTRQFQIPGQAILNVFESTGQLALPLFSDNPNLGQPVNAIFSQDLINNRIIVRVNNLLPLNIRIESNVRYFVGLTPIFFSFDSRPFDGIHLTNDFPAGNEIQSAVRQTAPRIEDWSFAGDVYGPPRQLFATIEIIGPPDFIIGDVSMDGAVNLLDVGPFIDLLSNGKFKKEADINGDGFVDLLDVEAFIQLLASGA